MEQKKKLSAFDIVGIVVLALGTVMTIIGGITTYAFTKGVSNNIGDIIVPLLGNIVMLIAYFIAFFYMVSGYKKNASKLYKAFMYAFVIKTLIWTILSMRVSTGGYLSAILILAIFLGSIVLATARDFGKAKTYIIAGLLLICQIIEFIIVVRLGARVIPMIVNMLLTIEACIMVLAKYRDKDARGTK